jgi:hypothetical protein
MHKAHNFINAEMKVQSIFQQKGGIMKGHATITPHPLENGNRAHGIQQPEVLSQCSITSSSASGLLGLFLLLPEDELPVDAPPPLPGMGRVSADSREWENMVG